MKHALIVSRVGTGASELMAQLVQEIGRPTAGYITKKEDALSDEVNGSPIYFYLPGQPRTHTADNLMGYCRDRRFRTIEGAFDRWAEKLGEPVPQDHLIVFDTIGFMESQEAAFCSAIMRRLDGEIPVLAAVRDYDFPFLNAVKAHPRCRCFHLTRENREACYREVLAFLQEQLRIR